MWGSSGGGRATRLRRPFSPSTQRHTTSPQVCKHQSPSRHLSPDSNSTESPPFQIRRIHPHHCTKTHHNPKPPLKYHLRCCGRLLKLVHKCHTSKVLPGYC
ncbi:hypothetical protein FA95DRAFT_759070 [Auriscalpium vulgare]|uniref:Uncharacterized protein n=1 Tax=Auriscalpium vulgare TaxID=40419 RepID=A0ACB8S0Y0_9AGAM|nr:hypothetical protein FA95DRAFT_759070 [Auriscalpium vulgare]